MSAGLAELMGNGDAGMRSSPRLNGKKTKSSATERALRKAAADGSMKSAAKAAAAAQKQMAANGDEEQQGKKRRRGDVPEGASFAAYLKHAQRAWIVATNNGDAAWRPLKIKEQAKQVIQDHVMEIMNQIADSASDCARTEEQFTVFPEHIQAAIARMFTPEVAATMNSAGIEAARSYKAKKQKHDE